MDVQGPWDSKWAGAVATHPSAAGPAGAWSRCPAGWLPGCEEGCWCHSGRAECSAGEETGHWDPRLRKHPPPTRLRGRLRSLPSVAVSKPPPTTTTTLPHTQPTHCSQTLGEGLRPKVATLSWEEEEDEPEEEGSGPLRVRGRGLVASPSILER